MSLPKKKKDLLINFVDHTCESCHEHEKKCGNLEIHRIRQGAEGGKYELNNIKVLCKHCHGIITSAQNHAGGLY